MSMVQKSELEELEKRMLDILKAIGNEGVCKYCGQKIWWTKTKNGKPFPVSLDFLPHFADCPNYRKT